MILPIVQVGDPVLRRPARPVTPEELRGPELRRLIADMRDTMRAAPGVGLAAPQVGRDLQLAVVEDRAEYVARVSPEERRDKERSAVEFLVIANPRLVHEPQAGEPSHAEFFEGCLSVAGYCGLVARSRIVRVEGLDEEGRPVTLRARGWYARILQHEIDHLNGVLYIDRIVPRSLCTGENFEQFFAGQPIEAVRAALLLPPRE